MQICLKSRPIFESGLDVPAFQHVRSLAPEALADPQYHICAGAVSFCQCRRHPGRLVSALLLRVSLGLVPLWTLLPEVQDNVRLAVFAPLLLTDCRARLFLSRCLSSDLEARSVLARLHEGLNARTAYVALPIEAQISVSTIAGTKTLSTSRATRYLT